MAFPIEQLAPDVAKLFEHLQCPVCLDICADSKMICKAGHLMCGGCLKGLRGGKCPTCRDFLIGPVPCQPINSLAQALGITPPPPPAPPPALADERARLVTEYVKHVLQTQPWERITLASILGGYAQRHQLEIYAVSQHKQEIKRILDQEMRVALANGANQRAQAVRVERAQANDQAQRREMIAAEAHADAVRRAKNRVVAYNRGFLKAINDRGAAANDRDYLVRIKNAGIKLAHYLERYRLVARVPYPGRLPALDNPLFTWTREGNPDRARGEIVV